MERINRFKKKPEKHWLDSSELSGLSVDLLLSIMVLTPGLNAVKGKMGLLLCIAVSAMTVVGYFSLGKAVFVVEDLRNNIT